MSSNKSVNIYTIAEEAGVSKSTVSRVLNNKSDVSKKTREKVLKVMKEFNYLPSKLARSLATNKTQTIGLIIPDIANPFFSEYIKGAEKKVIEEDYNLMLCSSHWTAKEELREIKMLREGIVDGVLMIGGGIDISESYLEFLEESSIPIVFIDRRVDSDNIPSVNVDNCKAAYKATNYLLELGHRKIACVKGPDVLQSSRDRVKGYEKALADFEIDYRLIKSGYFNGEDSHQATCEILKNHREVTAIFYANDAMALGGIRAIKEFGLQIPEDISIVGCDDLDIISLITPPLTTLKQPRYEMGYVGMEMLMNKIDDKLIIDSSKDIVYDMELIKRESVISLNKL
ncbi:LacI family DNA-binding transcriptional regulator [Orenia marismortui]|uniref:LacI family DNA-binding transcriptional regulator n=1 Tax=Orenia marismortui TaxID=46469 RepID=UPI000362DC2A|nr:LacI family DNA-binding transcriptional regulator [Orenia marismortui]